MSEFMLANERQSFNEEGGAITLTPEDVHCNAPPPAPPLPPSLLLGDPSQNQKRRVRSFYWKPIPEERIKQQDRPNLWTHGGEPTIHIDIRAIEEHFGQHDDDTQSSSTTDRKMAQRRGSLKDPRQQITILDFKRNMNISIFLKHLKKSGEDLLEDLLHWTLHETYSVESLRSLLKLLPEEEEVRTLEMFSGDPKDLTTADAFMYRLIHVPRYQLRLEALLLKREFFPSCLTMKQEITVVQTAITEILNCEELHSVLHLVLQAGNLLNAGGFAGNVVGFKLSSLLSLADTKANKPGMNLMHFVALEAQKKNLLMFPEKLLHVQQAAHLCVDSIHVELSSLSRRLHQVQMNIHTDDDLQTKLHSFLKSADEALTDLRLCCDEMVNKGNALIDFLCEDKETFKLHECFQIFQNFCSKFKKAVQENAEREMWEESRRKRLKESEDKRQSWAAHEGVRGSFGLRSSSEAALKREVLLDLLRKRPQNPDSPVLEFGSVQRIRQQKVSSESTDHRDTETQTRSPIHTLSITHSSEIHTETHTTDLHRSPIIKTKSDPDMSTTNFNPEETKIQETQEHNLQCQQAPEDEEMTSRVSLIRESEVICESQNQTEVSAEGVQPTYQYKNNQSLRTSGGSIQLNQTRINTSLPKALDSKRRSSSSSKLLSSSKPSPSPKTSFKPSPSPKTSSKPSTSPKSSSEPSPSPKYSSKPSPSPKTSSEPSPSPKSSSEPSPSPKYSSKPSPKTSSEPSPSLKSSSKPSPSPKTSSEPSPSPKTSSSFSKSSHQRPIRTLIPSETQSLRKIVPISRPGSSGPQNPERKSPGQGDLNISSAKKRESLRPTSEEKMCRATLRTLATPTVPNLSQPTPGFTRDTVASTTRHGVAPADRSNQPFTANLKRPPLTRTASLRLSQSLSRDPKKSSGVISKNSQGSLNKSVKPTWK
ncbi:uncharacterized protein [Paramisgurnus dabryanus]|uniref:uncharacterized protein isoform X2 n=1 Tax=Paramisgurnus dabryanus TaxID=90735 RepID=UPI0031F3B7BE